MLQDPLDESVHLSTLVLTIDVLTLWHRNHWKLWPRLRGGIRAQWTPSLGSAYGGTKSPGLSGDHSVRNASIVKARISWTEKWSSGLEEVGDVGNQSFCIQKTAKAAVGIEEVKVLVSCRAGRLKGGVNLWDQSKTNLMGTSVFAPVSSIQY